MARHTVASTSARVGGRRKNFGFGSCRLDFAARSGNMAHPNNEAMRLSHMATRTIGIGGDGSFAILRRLSQQGRIPLVGVPKTIDNDIGLTETSVGFDTAVSVATEALDRLQPTAASHARVMVLEVMGRDAGHIALHAGIAGGADVILLPEIPYRLEIVAAKIEQLKREGRNFALVIVAEAVKTEGGEQLVTLHVGGK